MYNFALHQTKHALTTQNEIKYFTCKNNFPRNCNDITA
jgi:hypothetical protein